MSNQNPRTSAFRLEVCVDSLQSAVAAGLGGACRLELCSALSVGGLTPSAGLIRMVRERANLPLHVLIRPRQGDFCYSADEFELMRRDISLAKEYGADGVVIGLLHLDGSIDLERTDELLKLVAPLSVTFHRAFDMARNPSLALEQLISLGIQRVLTSGQAPTAYEGRKLLTELVGQAGSRLIVMPGGGINERNIAPLVNCTGVQECHASARKQVESRMQFRREDVAMGAQAGEEYQTFVADENRIRAMLRAVAR